MEKNIKIKIGVLVVLGILVIGLSGPFVLAASVDRTESATGSFDILIDSDGDGTTEIFSVSHDSTISPIELFRIQENGNVGIGTTSPNYQLELSKPSGDPTIMFDINGNDKWSISVDDSESDKFLIQTTGINTPLITGDYSTAYVGIGTLNPNTQLHISTDDDGANVDLITFDRTTDSPADDDSYDIIFNHENDNSQQEDFAQITLVAEDVSDGQEGGLLKFSVADGVDGSMDEAMRIGKGDGTVDTDITFITLINAQGELCYIYPNNDQNDIIVSATHP